MDTSVSECVNIVETCDNNKESSSVNDIPLTNNPIEPSTVSVTIKEMIGDLHKEVSTLEEIVKKESEKQIEMLEEPSKDESSKISEAPQLGPSTIPRIVEIRREIKPLPLPPSFFETSLSEMDEQINHMFVRGVPRTRSTTSHSFTRIISRFNSTETTETVHQQRITSQNVTEEKSKRNFKFSNLKSSIFGKPFDNQDGTEESETSLPKPHAPWSSSVESKRIKFRISSLSRDVPFEAPDLHTGFIMDEAIKIASNNGRGDSKGNSLLQLLEKCILKNQN